MNSDIKDLPVGASLPAKQTELSIRSSHHNSWTSVLQPRVSVTSRVHTEVSGEKAELFPL